MNGKYMHLLTAHCYEGLQMGKGTAEAVTVYIEVCVACCLQARFHKQICRVLHKRLVDLVVEGIPRVPPLQIRTGVGSTMASATLTDE